MPHLHETHVIKLFGVLPQCVHLKPHAIEQAIAFRTSQHAEQHAWWIQFFADAEEEDKESNWLFQPVFGPVHMVFQL